MRINIVIDDKLMRDILRATGLKTKREAVEQGLRTLLSKRQEAIRRLRGTLDWRGRSERDEARLVDPGRFQRVDRLFGAGQPCRPVYSTDF